jgi:predicted Zn-ribbon and HTH transcriptional regulator
LLEESLEKRDMKSERGGFRMLRHEQLLQECVHDAYKRGAKLPEPARCRDCGAAYRNGRWTWKPAGEGARPVRCPACRRLREGMPAGYIRLSGGYLRVHREEIVRRMRRCEAAEKRAHPLQRIMAVAAERGDLVVTTTDSHLARRIGEALVKAFKGSAEYAYGREDNLLRVGWSRD